VDLVQRALARVEMHERLARVLDVHAAELGETDGAAAAVEQRAAQLIFQLADLL